MLQIQFFYRSSRIENKTSLMPSFFESNVVLRGKRDKMIIFIECVLVFRDIAEGEF